MPTSVLETGPVDLLMLLLPVLLLHRNRFMLRDDDFDDVYCLDPGADRASELAMYVWGNLSHGGLQHVTGFPYIHSQLTGPNSTLGTFRHGSLAPDAEQHTTGCNLMQQLLQKRPTNGKNSITSRRHVLVVLLPCVSDR